MSATSGEEVIGGGRLDRTVAGASAGEAAHSIADSAEPAGPVNGW
ncbi:hypothetical protein [Accumulibacter sp.]|nr:hypothetical protein [Accumulibacter sp.]MDS4050134.1 hypothetical protein [Accumulibacter sp.]